MQDTEMLLEAAAASDELVFVSDVEMIAFFNAAMPQGLKLLNAVCEGGSRESGELVFRFDLDRRFTNPVGFICGGYVAQMLDQAATYASSFVTGMASPSIDLKVSFIAPARPGRFQAHGKVLKAGSSIAFLEARLLDERGALVATGTITAQLLPFSTLVQKAAAETAR